MPVKCLPFQTSAFSMDTMVRSPFSRKRIIRPSIGRSSTMLNEKGLLTNFA